MDDDEETYLKTSTNVFMTKPAPPAGHSIAHEATWVTVPLMPILDPSTFHGYTDSLQAYIDAIRSLPAEEIQVGGEDRVKCDVVEVSIMKGQRNWRIWIACKDHLPRRLTQVVRVSYDICVREDWSNVVVNPEISNDKFQWQPPKEWKEWKVPGPDERLLKAGTPAPDFELVTIDGGKVKLSQYRGRVVYLYIWRGG